MGMGICKGVQGFRGGCCLAAWRQSGGKGAEGQREEWRAGVRVIDWPGLPVDDKLFGWLVGRSISWSFVWLGMRGRRRGECEARSGEMC